ncbi:hypothetical protein [Leptolyngbya ohadii]|uniref:hypothetical protein n=1 Tax=Leptolyngbya ohadii TaxID=1962290 RepID=UPI000B5A08F3|nr:hypothetical protein [Leptolyngbya ohadii]
MQRLPVFASLFLYALSLASPAFRFVKTFSTSAAGAGTPDIWNGLTVLLLGWLGFFFLQFGWAANPWYLLSLCWFWTDRWRGAAVMSGIALVFAANTLLLFRQTLPADEAGVGKLNLERLEVGFFFWISALLIPFVWSAVQLWRSQSWHSRSDDRIT